MLADTLETADYLTRRETEERTRAATTTDPCARRVHLDLAQRYAERRAALNAAPMHAV